MWLRQRWEEREEQRRSCCESESVNGGMEGLRPKVKLVCQS